MAENKVLPAGLMSDFDVSLFQSGKHFRLYEKMGAQLGKHEASEGCYFTVYAPNAYQVTVVGDFNKWNGEQHVLFPRWDKSGIWEGFIPGIKHGTIYKYKVYPHKFGRVRLDVYKRQIVGVQLFIAGFLGELVSRNAPDKNVYQVEKLI